MRVRRTCDYAKFALQTLLRRKGAATDREYQVGVQGVSP
jgi:hypothetical protein